MTVDKKSRAFSIIAAVSFLLTAFAEFINYYPFLLALTAPIVVFYAAFGVVLAIGKSDKISLRILSVVSFLLGLSLAGREIYCYIVSTPPIIGTVFDTMKVEIVYTTVYFVIYLYLSILFMYVSHSPEKVGKKAFSVLCILPFTVIFFIPILSPYDEYTMLTLSPAFLFTGLWIRREILTKNKEDALEDIKDFNFKY